MIVRVLVVVAGVVWLTLWMRENNRWREILGVFGGGSILFLGCAVAAFVASQVIVGLRWWILLRAQSIFISLWSAVRLHFLGIFYNNFLPSSVGGDLVRAWYVTMHTDKKIHAALSVFVDRGIGLLSMTIMAFVSWAVFMRGQTMGFDFNLGSGIGDFFGKYRWGLLGAAVVLVGVFAGLLANRRSRRFMARVLIKAKRKGVSLLKKMHDSIVIYCKRPLAIIQVFGLTFVSQSVVIIAFWLFGRMGGIEAGLKYYFVFFPVSWVLGAIPVSIGGAVVVEVILASMFIKFASVSEPAAAALALCQRVVWMLASIPGMVIYSVGAHLPKDFSIDYEEGVD